MLTLAVSGVLTLAVSAAPAQGALDSSAGATPGTGSGAPQHHSLAAAADGGGLQLAVNERGHISETEVATAGGYLLFDKPAGATVRSAYLAYATTGFTFQELTDPILLDNQPVPLDNEVASGIGSYNYFADVTSLVKQDIDNAPGTVELPVGESDPYLVDGEILTVIYDDPSVTHDQTVSIMYGALNPQGDTYSVHLARPIDTFDPSTRLQMSLGISFSYQTGGTQQFSTVDVDGQRMTSSAGGEDDGYASNGGLITAGGVGDSTDDPADPEAPPTNPRSDDELYDLTPFVHDGDQTINVATNNPSLDDNVFLAVFTMNPPVTSVVTQDGPAAQVLIVHGVTQNADTPIFTSLVDKVAAQVPDVHVEYFHYYQDKSGQESDGSCTNDFTQLAPQMPPDVAGLPYDTSQNSPARCDSEGDIGQNAVRLDQTVQRMYADGGVPVILVGYSMGGETIRSFLAYSTSVNDGVAASMLDSVVTLHGVQQGSALALGGAFIRSQNGYMRKALEAIARTVAPDPDRLANRQFNPDGAYLHWVHAHSAALPQIPYYNTWGDEHLAAKACLAFGHLCATSEGGSLGDIILLPGNDSPTDNTVFGGERFLPTGYTDHSWQWREHMDSYYDPFNVFSEISAIKGLFSAPQFHSNIPNDQGKVTIQDCQTGEDVSEDEEIARVMIARLNGTTYACNPELAQ